RLRFRSVLSLPPDLALRMQECGGAEYQPSLSSTPPARPQSVGGITDNDRRVLQSLRYAFGEPFESRYSGALTEDQRQRMQRLPHYTWCPTDAMRVYAVRCTAQVVYAYDTLSGDGLVFLATPAVYAYLYSSIIDRNNGLAVHRHDWYYFLMLPDPPLEYER